MDLIISSVTHRCGSTLLQRIFNAREKTLIWGEQLGLVSQFCNIYDKLIYCAETSKNVRKDYFENQNPNLWIANLFPEERYVEKAMIKGLKSILEQLYSSHSDEHDLIGFKEVRYGKRELTLIKSAYPQITIILLNRNPVDVWRSMPNSWRNPLDVFIKKWNNNSKDYLQFNKEFTNTFIIRFEDIINKNKSTIELIKKKALISRKQLNNVLSHKIHSFRSEIAKKEEEIIKSRCKKLMQEFNYA